MSLDVADGFTQLVFHVLAHVVRPGPENLYDDGYVAWARERFSAEATALLAEDAEVLGALAHAEYLEVLDAWPQLHGSLAAFRRTAGRALAEVRADEVQEARLLKSLQGTGPAGEVMHAAMGLLAGEFAGVHARWIAPWGREAAAAVLPWTTALGEAAPGLASARVELVWALGRRGRALPGRVLVGCGDWRADPVTPAIAAMHEYAVWSSGQVDYVRTELDALSRGARWVAAAPARLREAHARWLAGLELRPLVARAQRTGLIGAAVAGMLAAPEDRARVLRKLTIG